MSSTLGARSSIPASATRLRCSPLSVCSRRSTTASSPPRGPTRPPLHEAARTVTSSPRNARAYGAGPRLRCALEVVGRALRQLLYGLQVCELQLDRATTIFKTNSSFNNISSRVPDRDAQLAASWDEKSRGHLAVRGGVALGAAPLGGGAVNLEPPPSVARWWRCTWSRSPRRAAARAWSRSLCPVGRGDHSLSARGRGRRPEGRRVPELPWVPR